MKKKLIYGFGVFFIILLFVKCIEPYSPETETFEDVLVIEAKLTNSNANQKVKITRAHRLEIDTLIMETNAQVRINDQNNNTYQFSELEPGIYFSDEVFKAEPNMGYSLYVTTSDGKQYESRKEYLTPESEIANLYTEEEIINGKRGVQIYVDSDESVGDAKHLMYEFEETYKIITPYQINKNMNIINLRYGYNGTIFYNVEFSTVIPPKPQVCYTTLSQKNIILANTDHYSTNAIQKLPIKFIPDDSYLIRERYSILVKQYVQSYDSYSFYKLLKELGNLGSFLEENQTGYIQGNIFSKENNNEKVIGFFDVVSIATKRIYFNYETFNYDKPQYQFLSTPMVLDYRDASVEDGDINERQRIFEYIDVVIPPWELISFEIISVGDDEFIPIVELVNPECGDCTTFSSDVVPDFWED